MATRFGTWLRYGSNGMDAFNTAEGEARNAAQQALINDWLQEYLNENNISSGTGSQTQQEIDFLNDEDFEDNFSKWAQDELARAYSNIDSSTSMSELDTQLEGTKGTNYNKKIENAIQNSLDDVIADYQSTLETKLEDVNADILESYAPTTGGFGTGFGDELEEARADFLTSPITPSIKTSDYTDLIDKTVKTNYNKTAKSGLSTSAKKAFGG